MSNFESDINFIYIVDVRNKYENERRNIMSQEINNSPEVSKVTYANSSTQTSVSEGSTKTLHLFEDMQKKQEAKEKYEKQLVAHRENINKLLEQGEYLKALYAFVNPPKNPNLITGTAPDAAFGTLGMIKMSENFY